MMDLNVLRPRQALNKAYLKLKPTRSEIEVFKTELIKLIDQSNDIESEEFHKNLVSNFLKNTYYKEDHFINTKDTKDLVIHERKTAGSPVNVIIEAKKPTNKSEMITVENINAKAFQETILYFLRERILDDNKNIKYLIITNIYEWFIFDATLFEKLFVQNKKFVKEFKDFNDGKLSGKKTDFFYKEIAKPFIASIEYKVEFVHFDIRKYEKPLRNDDKKDDTKLIALYKLLSPQHLLKLAFINDSNTLDKKFYSEFLHLIGLIETKKGSKRVIERLPEEKRNSASLMENTIIQLDSEDGLSNLDNLHQFGETYEDQLFGVGIELVITWVNRILFLKLLESQLVAFHKDKDEYSFLNIKKINNFDDLNRLFFQVLAKRHSERNEDVKLNFSNTPYLNSSLFEPTGMERKTLKISNLVDDKDIPVFKATILKDENGRKFTGDLNAIDYFFRFLDAYDFSSENSEDIQEENKSLINASVLGLIYEKINGFKDGAFFTPGFVTMYMCRETLRQVVIEKFNSSKKWNCKTIIDLYNKIDDANEANDIVNSIHICDPSVGSGHFLVSALNEIIYIKHELGILMDDNGKRIKDFNIDIVNDELMMSGDDGELFEYKLGNSESQRIQKALFHEKERIIENCLFGVDINTNSVMICRLRLWIELLKNAYYKNETELETLPNIDINIKCGNSLISRFDNDVDLKSALKKSKIKISDYKSAVKNYKNAKSKQEKRDLETLIDTIKSSFTTEIYSNDKRFIKLNSFQGELSYIENQPDLFEVSKADKARKNKRVKELRSGIDKLEKEIDEIKNNKLYENAFEWRFEFPEVMNDKGAFIGFDAIIGNPPYGVSVKGKEREILVSNISKVPDYEIYYWFIDRARQLIKGDGVLNYIIPNTVLFNLNAQNYRLEIMKDWKVNEILDCTDLQIFEGVTVRNIILSLANSDSSNTLTYKKTNELSSFNDLICRDIQTVDEEFVIENNKNWGLIFKLSKETLQLVSKIREQSRPLSSYFSDSSQGLIAYDKYQGQSQEIIESRAYHYKNKAYAGLKSWLWGEDVVRYSVEWNEKEYINYCDGIANPRKPKYFQGKRILIREITNPRIYAAYTEDELYNDPSILIIKDNPDSDIGVLSLLAILNSKLATFYHFNSSPKATKGAFPKILVDDINNFCLPISLTEKENEKLEGLAQKLMIKDSDAVEEKIDELVYKLYKLTPEEIAIIEETF